ncbi:MAG: cation:proton antiporter [Acidiferrobacteraceae bacterium]
MHPDPLLYIVFLIFTGAAVIATIALLARQALIVSYIILGVLLGPSVLNWTGDAALIKGAGDIGIMFLLFLLGLNMHPQKLIRLLGSTTLITGASALLFAAVGVATGAVLGLPFSESLILGGGLMFSSTIVGLKLLPTTVLHHRHTGELIISILLLQDVLAILMMLWLQAGAGSNQDMAMGIARLLGALAALSVFAYLVERYVLSLLIVRFDVIQEYIFLLAIGWCLGLAELAVWAGLSREMGAFVAGVALARSRISMFIAESLKPLRDFFLIIFFFTLGAGLNLRLLADVVLPATVLAVIVLAAKPIVFRYLLRYAGEEPARANEIGVRLGQNSEFAFLIAVLAGETGAAGHTTVYLLELSTILTMMVSMYLIVWRYPTPIAVRDELRRS